MKTLAVSLHISILCHTLYAKFISLHTVELHTFHPVDILLTEHMTSVATTSEIGTQRKLLSIQGKPDITHSRCHLKYPSQKKKSYQTFAVVLT